MGRPSRGAPQHLIPSKEPECGRFIARVLTQIPQPRKHGVHYFGAYSSKARACRAKAKLTLQSCALKDTQAAQVWFDRPGAPKPKLANEEPKPETIDYDTLIKSWQK